jgi:hypothetical protein
MNRKTLALTAVIVALAATVVLTGKATPSVTPDISLAGSHPMLRTELYFAAIDVQAWDRFLADEITSRFPDGLSWYDVNGQWRGPSGQPEKLPSRLVILIHADNAANREALATVGRLFQQRHGLAVLQVVQHVQASDPDWTADRLEENRQLSR